jgi:hypothetical protein
LDQVSPIEFSSLVLDFGVKGLDASMGYADLASAYAQFLQEIADHAGCEAVAQWLSSKATA